MMGWLYIYAIGFIISAAIIGAFTVPASTKHTGHPADDPIVFVFLAFLWPLIVACIPLAIVMWGAAYIGGWVGSKLLKLIS